MVSKFLASNCKWSDIMTFNLFFRSHCFSFHSLAYNFWYFSKSEKLEKLLLCMLPWHMFIFFLCILFSPRHQRCCIFYYEVELIQMIKDGCSAINYCFRSSTITSERCFAVLWNQGICSTLLIDCFQPCKLVTISKHVFTMDSALAPYMLVLPPGLD